MVTCEGMAVAACITVRDQVLPTYLEAPSRTIDDVAIAPGVNGRLVRVRTCLNFQPICQRQGDKRAVHNDDKTLAVGCTCSASPACAQWQFRARDQPARAGPA